MRQGQIAATAQISRPDVTIGGLPAMDSTFPISTRRGESCRLLWVDDSEVLLSLYRAVFENFGFEVLTTSSPVEAIFRVSSGAADLAILDYDMPGINGGALASLMKQQSPMLPIILFTGSTSVPHWACHCVDAICAKAAPRAELLTVIGRLSGLASIGDSPSTQSSKIKKGAPIFRSAR